MKQRRNERAIEAERFSLARRRIQSIGADRKNEQVQNITAKDPLGPGTGVFWSSVARFEFGSGLI